MPSNMEPVLTDAGKLGQCLLNLLSNAAKFTKDGRIELRVTREDEMLCFAVADTGIGIADADQARLFQPFTQVDDSNTRMEDGTGLGLVITRRLAELMGGDVAFTSAPGEGSVFTLRVTAPSAEAALRPADRACILVVEDEPDARDLLRRALSALPFDVRLAAGVAEGLAAFHALDPAVVVLDIHLPDGSGWDVLAEMRRVRPHTPVLVVTIDDDRARALAQGASEHILKPADRDQVAAAVLRLAASGQAAAA
jgi:CheY-like chemotaxis protein/anti-sigma regulatory factor (Ser/Thr protein kinase)